MGDNPGGADRSSTVKQDGTKLNPGDQGRPGTPGMAENVCRTCSGTGKVGGAECPNCGGTGKVMEELGGA